jgi:hypothetical protein
MTSDPEEPVRLQAHGEMTLRSAIATLMALPLPDRAAAIIFRIRDTSTLTPHEIAELASDWGIAPTLEISAPTPNADRDWQGIVRGMVREAPLPSLMIAFLVGVLVTRR